MRTLIAISLLAIASQACRRSETPAPPTPQVAAPGPATLPGVVREVELGKAVGANQRVTSPATVFAPDDTIYASVLTEGQPSGATLSAHWTYEDGQVVSEGREVLTAGRVATEFHIAKPDGWPVGRYHVEITLNGQPVGAREFEVR